MMAMCNPLAGSAGSGSDAGDWAQGVDVGRASVARIYDYLLGGTHNFAVDRQAAQGVAAANPRAPMVARANRGFLARAVRDLAHRGVRQFLDVGSGIPTAGNVHEVAQRVAFDARVLYVDIDPVAALHGLQILRGNSFAGAMTGDVRRPNELLSRITGTRELAGIIDFDQPIALLLVAVLPFVADEAQPYDAVAVLRDVLVPGSYLVMSHATAAGLDAEAITAGQQVYRQQAASSIVPRTREEILRFFGDFKLLDPGLVWTPEWRPDEGRNDFADEPWRADLLAGVGRKVG